MLRAGDGAERAGEDLRRLVEEARIIRNVLNGLHQPLQSPGGRAGGDRRRAQPRISRDCRDGRGRGRLHRAAPRRARRRDRARLAGRFAEGDGFVFERTVRGVKEPRSSTTRCSARPTRASSTATPRRCRRLSAARHAAPQGRRRSRSTARSSLFEAVTAAGPQGHHDAALQRPGRDEPRASSGRRRSTPTPARCCR